MPPPADPVDAEEEARDKARARRIDLGKVPERAFACADWLRAFVMRDFPHCAVGRVNWGADKAGRRLVWAKELTVIDAANHLFDGRVMEVADAIEDLLGDFGRADATG